MSADKKDKGVALLELAIGLSLLFFTLPSTIQTFLVLEKKMETAFLILNTETEYRYMIHIIENDFFRSDAILETDETSVKIKTLDGNSITYFLKEDRLGRREDNGPVMYLTTRLKLDRVKIKQITPKTMAFRFHFSGNERERIACVQ